MIQFRELLKRLHDNKVDFIVIGGVAGALHGSPVATFDLDVCAPMDDANLLHILDAVRGLNPRFRMRPDKMRFPDDLDRLRGIHNIYLLTDLGILDILGDLPGIGSWEGVKDRIVEMNIGGFTCRVLDLETLIAAKKVANREKDQPSIVHLERIKRYRETNPGLFPE